MFGLLNGIRTRIFGANPLNDAAAQREQTLREFKDALRNINFKSYEEYTRWSDKIYNGLVAILLPADRKLWTTYPRAVALKIPVDPKFELYLSEKLDSSVNKWFQDFRELDSEIWIHHNTYTTFRRTIIGFHIAFIAASLALVLINPTAWTFAIATAFSMLSSFGISRGMKAPKYARVKPRVAAFFAAALLGESLLSKAAITAFIANFSVSALIIGAVASMVVGAIAVAKITDYLLRDKELINPANNYGHDRFRRICEDIEASPKIKEALSSLESAPEIAAESVEPAPEADPALCVPPVSPTLTTQADAATRAHRGNNDLRGNIAPLADVEHDVTQAVLRSTLRTGLA